MFSLLVLPARLAVCCSISTGIVVCSTYGIGIGGINGRWHRNEYVAVASTCSNLIVHPKIPDDKFIFIASVHGDLVIHFVANRAHPSAVKLGERHRAQPWRARFASANPVILAEACEHKNVTNLGEPGMLGRAR